MSVRSIRQLGVLSVAVVMIVGLGNASVAFADSFDDLAGSAPIIGAAVQEASSGEDEGYTSTSRALFGGLRADQDAALSGRPELGGWGFGPQAVSVHSSSEFSAWGGMDFGAAGDVRWRLMQRRAPTGSAVDGSGQAVAFADAADLGGGVHGVHVSVVGRGMVEEFVVAPDGAQDHGLDYELELPSGWRLVQSGAEVWVETESGDRALSVSAPVAQDEIGALFTARVEVSGPSSVSVVVSPAAASMGVGRVTIDPIFSTATIGELSRKFCAADATDCAGSGDSLPAGLTSAAGSDYTLSGNAGASNWGVHLAATAGNTFTDSESGWIRYTPPANLSLDAWFVDMRMDDPNDRFECRAEGHVSGTAPSVQNAYFGTNATDFSSTVNPTGPLVWAGVRIRHAPATSWTSGSTANNKCSLSNETRNKLRADLLDVDPPTQVTPAVAAASATSTITFNDPSAWVGAGTRQIAWDSVDVGSGIHRLRFAINNGETNEWLAPTYTSVCDPASVARRDEAIPCALDPAASTVSLLINSDRAVQGANKLHTAAFDYSGRGSFSGGSTFYFDSVAPSGTISATPAGPIRATQTLSGTASDATSGVGSVAVSYSGPSAGSACSDTSVTTAWSCSWNTSALAAGLYTLTVIVSDKAGNTSATLITRTISVDNADPNVQAVSFTESVGSAFQHAAGTTMYYNPAQAGSFSVGVTATDQDSGMRDVAFPDLDGAGTLWSPGGQLDSASPWTVTYSWAAGAAEPGAREAIATDVAGNDTPAPFTVLADSSPPTDATISVTDEFQSTTTAPVEFTTGSDTLSGVASWQIERDSSPLAGGTCTGWTTYSPVGSINPASPSTDTTLASGQCYRYRLAVTDRVGQVATFADASVIRVDSAAPAQSTPLDGAVAGTDITTFETTSLAANWTAPTDEHSSVASITACLTKSLTGVAPTTCAGAVQTTNTLPASSTSHTWTIVAPAQNTYYHTCIIATDALGNASQAACSDGAQYLGAAFTYTYDGDGNRLTQTTSGDTTSYVWDTSHANAQLALERSNGTLMRAYLIGQQRISFTTPQGISYYLFDYLGSVTDVTDAAGTAQWSFTYEPFGSSRRQADLTGP